MKKKSYSSDEAFGIFCFFVSEIYHKCSDTFNNQSETKKFYPILQSSVLTEEQFRKIIMLVSDMHCQIDWDIEWQESIMRLHLCRKVSKIESLRLLECEILKVAYEMIASYSLRWNFDFAPILYVLKKIMQRDKNFATASKIWKEILSLHVRNPGLDYFSYRSYSQNLINDHYQHQGKIVFYTSEQRLKIEKQVQAYALGK